MIEKLDMDMTFDDLCKVCFTKNEYAFREMITKKAMKTKRLKGLIRYS